MTNLEKRVANRLKRGASVLAEWTPPRDNPQAARSRTLVFRDESGDYQMTGWPNGEIGEYSRSFESPEEAAKAFVGTVGTSPAIKALSARKSRR